MSDYIERLRGELLRAGATQPRRARVHLPVRGLIVAAAVAAIIAAVVFALPSTGGGERAVTHAGATFTVAPPEAADATARVLRERLGTVGASVAVTGDGQLTITPSADAAGLTQPGRFAIYDWEDSVIGVKDNSDPALSGSVSRAEAAARGGTLVRGDERGNGWYALRGSPALTNSAIASARASTDPIADEPTVIVQLTPSGHTAFTHLLRTLALRGPMQHLAIVIDGVIVTSPYVRFGPNDPGPDAGTVDIIGGLTPESAKALAAVLDSGPLPGTLTPG